MTEPQRGELDGERSSHVDEGAGGLPRGGSGIGCRKAERSRIAGIMPRDSERKNAGELT